MFINIISSFLLQIVFTVGIIFLFGGLIAVCNKKFYANFSNIGNKICLITGFIGTPIHELSHALFCLIFGHKIIEIKFFQISSADGTLGYVKHSYNKKNIYQRIGNLFIGVAPIIVISSLLYFVAYLLLPSFTKDLAVFAKNLLVSGINKNLENAVEIICAFFKFSNSWQWWIYVIVGLFLALHMTLSIADIKGAVSGLIAFFAIILIIDIVLALVSESTLTVFSSGMIIVGSWLLCALLLSLMLSFMLLAVSCVYKLFFNRFVRK